MGITGKRSSFVGLIPSFRLVGEASSKYREKRPGWPAPVNAGRALPFESFRQTLPGDPPAEWSFRAVRKSDKVDLFLPPSFPAEAGGIYFFPFGRQIRSHAPQLFRKDRSGWILSLKRSAWSSGQERELSGLLHRKEGWGIANTRNYLRLRATFSEE